MTCKATEKKLAEAKQLIADFANEAQKRGLIDMSAVPGFAVPTLLMGGAALPGTYAYRTHIEDTANATTYSGGSWNSIAIGDADANRYVLVAVWGNAGTRTVSSMTIGGVSATLVSDGTDSARLQHSSGTGEFWIAAVPTGTTANISVTWSGAQDRCGATVWTIVRPTSTTAVDVKTSNSASPASVTLDTASNGVVFAIHGQNGGGTCTWTNVTERHDTTIEAGATHTGADAATSGSSLAVTATFTGSPAVRTLVAVSFNLAATVPTAPRILDSYSNVTGAFSLSRYLLSSAESAGLSRYTTDVGISQITDQTGNSRHLIQGTGANQPSVVSVGPQTRAGARFDGTNDSLSGSIVESYINNNAGYVACCAIPRAVDTNSGTPGLNDPVFYCGGGMVLKNSSGTYSWLVLNDDGSVDSVGDTFGTSPIDVVHVFEWRHEGGTLYGRVTATGSSPGAWQSISSGNTAAGSMDPLVISLGVISAYSQNDVLEMVTFDAVPNDTQKDALVTNMLAHYG